jgi:CubicO group peptidase (beta-lactamase class C family)
VYGAPDHLPTRNFYSNTSVGLLGQVLMNIDGYTQLTLPDFNGWMCEHVLGPLAMLSTNACLPSEAAMGTCTYTGPHCDSSGWMSGQYATGYVIADSTYQENDPFPYVPWAPAGGLRSNLVDLIKYMKANLGISTSSPTPAETNLIAGMLIAQTSNNYLPVPSGHTVEANIGDQPPLLGGQGFAWVCEPHSTSPNAVCGKIGGHPTFRSFLGFSHSKKYGIIILFNTGNAAAIDGLAVIPGISNIGVNMIANSKSAG